MADTTEKKETIEKAQEVATGFLSKLQPVHYVGATVLVTAIAFGAYWMIGTNIAEKEVRKTLRNNALMDYVDVDYKGVGFDPFSGDVTVEDVTLSVPESSPLMMMLGRRALESEIKVQEVVIREVEDSDSDLLIDVSLNGVPMDFVQLSQNRMFDDISERLMDLGYQNSVANIDVQIDHDKEDDVSSGRIGLSGEQLGELVLEADVINITTTKVLNVVMGTMAGRFRSPNPFKMLGGVELDRLAIDYQDDSLAKRISKMAKRTLIKNPSDTESNVNFDAFFGEFLENISKRGMSHDQAS